MLSHAVEATAPTSISTVTILFIVSPGSMPRKRPKLPEFRHFRYRKPAPPSGGCGAGMQEGLECIGEDVGQGTGAAPADDQGKWCGPFDFGFHLLIAEYTLE